MDTESDQSDTRFGAVMAAALTEVGVKANITYDGRVEFRDVHPETAWRAWRLAQMAEGATDYPEVDDIAAWARWMSDPSCHPSVVASTNHDWLARHGLI